MQIQEFLLLQKNLVQNFSTTFYDGFIVCGDIAKWREKTRVEPSISSYNDNLWENGDKWVKPEMKGNIFSELQMRIQSPVMHEAERLFYKNATLKNFAILIGKNLCWSLF